jgi:hypothetical protein
MVLYRFIYACLASYIQALGVDSGLAAEVRLSSNLCL